MRKVSVIAITATYLDVTFATTANITSVVETGDYFVRTVIYTIIWASFPMSLVNDMKGEPMDLIERQAAIDAIENAFDRETILNRFVRKIAISAVRLLPSAEPEKVCIANITLSEEQLREAVEKAKNEVVHVSPFARPEQEWIPVTERLPEDNTLMLVNYIDSRPYAMDIWIGWHEMENVWYIDGEEHSRERGNEVIAWMPLPEPYRAERRTDE